MAKYVSKENLEYIWKNKLKPSLDGKQNTLTEVQKAAINSGITSTLVQKLNEIQDGAEKNVQADWDEKDKTAASYIKNHPEVNNGVLTLKVEGNTIGTFSANQDSSTNVNITLSGLGLTNTLVFKGVFSTLPSEADYPKGSVVIVGNKEYVKTDSGWTELGDEGAYALKTTTISTTGVLSGGGNLSTNRTISHANIGSAASLGFYKIGTDAYGHINTHTAVTKSDITALGIPSSDTNQKISVGSTKFGDNTTINLSASGDTKLTADESNIYISTTSYGLVNTTSNGMMSASDKSKLNGIADNATCVYIDTSILTTGTGAAQSGAVRKNLNSKVNTSDSLTEAEINSICQ